MKPKTYYEVQKRSSRYKRWERSYAGNPSRDSGLPECTWVTSIARATRRAQDARKYYAALEYRIAKLPATANIDTGSFNRVVKVVRHWKAISSR